MHTCSVLGPRSRSCMCDYSGASPSRLQPHTSTYAYTSMYMHICVCTCVYTHICMCIHIICIYRYMYVYVCVSAGLAVNQKWYTRGWDEEARTKLGKDVP